MMNAYLDKGLKAVYAVAIAAVLIAALRPLAGQQQAQQTVAAQPQQPIAQASPAQPVQPSPAQPQQPQQQQQFYDPVLAAKVDEVRHWTPQAIQDWIQFCHQTAGGTGFTVEDQRICLAVSILQKELQP